VRRDVLELLAEEVGGHPVDALASFQSWEDGRRRLDGMAKGRRWDIDREQRQWERDSRAELRRLAKRDEQRRHRDRYRVRYLRWAAAHRDHLVSYWRWYWRQPENVVRARERQRRKGLAEKADPQRYAKRMASWRAFRWRQSVAAVVAEVMRAEAAA
jgi:hypothetical protein